MNAAWKQYIDQNHRPGAPVPPVRCVTEVIIRPRRIFGVKPLVPQGNALRELGLMPIEQIRQRIAYFATMRGRWQHAMELPVVDFTSNNKAIPFVSVKGSTEHCRTEKAA